MQLNSIRFLRAIAATLVVYAHSIDLTQRFSKSYQQSFYFLSDVACIGVDLFFVISGFIITYVARKYTGHSEGWLFLEKRFYRINPIYYIASLLFLGTIVLQFALAGRSYPFASETFINSLIDTFLILPLSPDIFSPLLLIGWTLSFEWLFYILFFLSILFKFKRKPLFLCVIIIVLVLFGYLIRPATDLRISFITNPILLEFVLGIMICLLYQQIKIPVAISLLLLLTGISWYVILVFTTNPAIAAIAPILDGSLSMDRFVNWGLPSGLIATGCIFLEKSGHAHVLWENRLSQLTGDASYSIYLVHFPVFSLFMLVYRNTGLLVSPDISILLQILVALAVGIAFYWSIEKPLLRWLQKSRRKSEPPVITTATSTAT